MSVQTKIGQRFLAILDSSFPASHPLHKVLNRHRVQLSYRTMPNLGRIITGHDKKVLKNDLPVQRPFNSNCICRRGPKNHARVRCHARVEGSLRQPQDQL